MAAVEIKNEATTQPKTAGEARSCKPNLIGLSAAGALLTGAALLLAGRKRSGAVAAVSGATLALLDQQDTVRAWWRALPETIDDVQKVLGKVQDAVNEVAVRRERLERILSR